MNRIEFAAGAAGASEPYTWDNVPPREKTPRLQPTIVLTPTKDTRYEEAHEALHKACVAVAALVSDHRNADEVSALVDRAMDVFEDTVRLAEPADPPEREFDAADKERCYAHKYGDSN